MAQAQAAFTVQIGGAIVPAGDPAAVAQAIVAANAKARVDGVDDAFNPNLIDPGKAQALLAALLRDPGDLAARLGGRALDLTALHMRIGVSSPTTVASFAAAKVELTLDHPLSYSGRAVVAVDCDGAAARVGEARRRAEAAKEKPARFLLSHAWLDNAEAVLSCRPGDAAAKADRDAADRLMRASMVPTGSMQ